MYASDANVASVQLGFASVPARIPAAMHFNYHPTLAAQRLDPILGWSNYLCNAALRNLTQGEGNA